MSKLMSLAAEINREHNLAEQMAKTAIEHALKAGELLIQAKDQCSHGEWLPWMDGNLDIGTRQAQKYMRLVTHRERLANTNPNSYLSIDDALAVIAAPRETEQADKQAHEMLKQALAVIDQLEPARLTQPDLVDTVLQEMDLPYVVMLKIMADGARGSDGVIWRSFSKRIGMIEKARERASYFAGLTVQDIADQLGVSVTDVIMGLCKEIESTPDTLRKCLAVSSRLDYPPDLPSPDDLRGYVRQQVGIELSLA